MRKEFWRECIGFWNWDWDSNSVVGVSSRGGREQLVLGDEETSNRYCFIRDIGVISILDSGFRSTNSLSLLLYFGEQYSRFV
ncbi:unnamed protein product [Ilex paraguariensis]|uniref:Uncharacterized protein n=1 Tax=Ilex paraguariensis TaxID=185542 RepID=A0ABC8TKC1_9AQUA